MKRALTLLLTFATFTAPLSNALAFDLFSGGTVAGTMGNIEITVAQLKELIDAQTPDVRKALYGNPDALKDLIRAELLRRTLVAEARQAEWDKRPAVALTMERAREQSLLDAYLNAKSEPPANYPSDQEISTAYDANKPQFTIPVQLRLAQILLRLPENAPKTDADRVAAQARDLWSKLNKGALFSQLVADYSQDEGSKSKNGDLGWLAVNAIMPQIRSELVNLRPGEYSRPIRTPFGWQIVKVIDKKPESVRPLSEVREAIVKALRDAKLQENRSRYLENLSKSTPATIAEKALKEFKGSN